MIENFVKYFSHLPTFFMAKIAQIKCKSIINKAEYPEHEWMVRANLFTAVRNIIEVPDKSQKNPATNTTNIHIFSLWIIRSVQMAVL